MTPEKILETIEIYRKFFEESGFKKVEHLHDELLTSNQAGFEHCYGMLDRMVRFVHEGRTEKAFRWLDFIQGFLWAHRIYTLAELKDHNRTKGLLDP